MPTIKAKDRNGDEHSIEAPLDAVLMKVLKEIGRLDIEAICGGNCNCGTCHVYVDPAWLQKLPAQSQNEIELLDQLVHTTEHSRLSCQIEVTEDLDGLSLQLAPEE